MNTFLTLFLFNRFQLNSFEVSIVRSSDISSEIFSVLDKSNNIISNCKLILQNEKYNLAQDVLEQMFVYQVSNQVDINYRCLFYRTFDFI